MNCSNIREGEFGIFRFYAFYPAIIPPPTYLCWHSWDEKEKKSAAAASSIHAGHVGQTMPADSRTHSPRARLAVVMSASCSTLLPFIPAICSTNKQNQRSRLRLAANNAGRDTAANFPGNAAPTKTGMSST